MKKIIAIIGISCCSVSFGQDLHFAQTSQTPLFINPAAAGVFDGWERVSVNHRNQWLGGGTQFMTTAIGADANFGKGQINNKAHLGAGIQLFNDVGGDSKYGNQAASLTLSGILPMGYGHSLSAGIQGGYGQRKADISRLSFMSQWNGSYLDPTILSGEANSVTSFRYIDASAGLYYVYDGSKNNFARKNEMKIQFGLAGFHLNAPELKFSNGINGERLHRKYVGNLGIVSDIVGSKFAIDASVVQFVQGGHYETLLGMMVRYRFEDGTKMTGLSHNAFVGFGCYTRLKDAIIPSVMVDWRGFQFGVSYDITLSALRYAYKGGSLEFSLTYRNVHDALFKTRKRRF